MHKPNEQVVRIKVKTGQKETKILEEKDGVIYLAVHAPAQENKANIEIIKFFTRRTKKYVRIISGKTSKEKLIGIE